MTKEEYILKLRTLARKVINNIPNTNWTIFDDLEIDFKSVVKNLEEYNKNLNKKNDDLQAECIRLKEELEVIKEENEYLQINPTRFEELEKILITTPSA